MITESTKEVRIPKNPLDRIIGQEEIVEIAKIVATQRRHLLLVGPPGTGKSLIAQAIASILPIPTQEISVLHNPKNPERPIVDIRKKEEIEKEKEIMSAEGKILSPSEVPSFVAERLGFRCRRCGSLSKFDSPICPRCGADKYKGRVSPFDDLIFGFVRNIREDKIHTTRILPNGREEVVIFERTKDGMIRLYDQETLEKMEKIESKKLRKVIVPLERNTFVQATGASETELLGDVRHDPYGSHPEVGVPQYLCVLPGAIHEAHEGVLFIDEISNLGHIQRYLLTAMEEKRFPITGRNPSSSGASIKVENVPCDFVLIGALNINDIDGLLPPLRSRIVGNGYEVLMNTVMPDTEENRGKFVQFIAQEIRKDGKIPDANRKAVLTILEEARKRAREIDDVNGLTLRLRNLAGIIKLAGDLAILEKSEYIDENHIKAAIDKGKTIEEQINDKYGSWWKAGISDYGGKKRKFSETDVG